MKIRVKLFATLVRRLPEKIQDRLSQTVRAGTPFEAELADGSTLEDLVNHLELPREELKVTFVNGRAQPLDYRLSPDDEVGIFPPIGGG